MWKRIWLAIGIVLFDFIIFGIPLGSLFLGYIIIDRPKWFSDLVTRKGV